LEDAQSLENLFCILQTHGTLRTGLYFHLFFTTLCVALGTRCAPESSPPSVSKQAGRGHLLEASSEKMHFNQKQNKKSSAKMFCIVSAFHKFYNFDVHVFLIFHVLSLPKNTKTDDVQVHCHFTLPVFAPTPGPQSGWPPPWPTLVPSAPSKRTSFGWPTSRKPSLVRWRP